MWEGRTCASGFLFVSPRLWKFSHLNCDLLVRCTVEIIGHMVFLAMSVVYCVLVVNYCGDG